MYKTNHLFARAGRALAIAAAFAATAPVMAQAPMELKIIAPAAPGGRGGIAGACAAAGAASIAPTAASDPRRVSAGGSVETGSASGRVLSVMMRHNALAGFTTIDLACIAFPSSGFPVG